MCFYCPSIYLPSKTVGEEEEAGWMMVEVFDSHHKISTVEEKEEACTQIQQITT